MSKKINRPRPPSTPLTQEQIYTTVGLFSGIISAILLKDAIPIPLLLAMAVGYSIGSSTSVAIYRVAGLLKNGSTEQNAFGTGTLAGLAVAFGIISVQSTYAIFYGNHIINLSVGPGLAIGAFGLIAGFLQSRSNFDIVAGKFVVGDEQQNE